MPLTSIPHLLTAGSFLFEVLAKILPPQEGSFSLYQTNYLKFSVASLFHIHIWRHWPIEYGKCNGIYVISNFLTKDCSAQFAGVACCLLSWLWGAKEPCCGTLCDKELQAASKNWGWLSTHSQQETKSFSPTMARNWALPTARVRWEARPSPEASQIRLKSQTKPSFFSFIEV